MKTSIQFLFSIMSILMVVFPLVAIICCAHLEPKALFRRLSASPCLRSMAVLLLVVCSAYTGAFLWGMVYATYTM